MSALECGAKRRFGLRCAAPLPSAARAHPLPAITVDRARHRIRNQKRFGKSVPDRVLSLEDLVAEWKQKKAEKKATKRDATNPDDVPF